MNEKALADYIDQYIARKFDRLITNRFFRGRVVAATAGTRGGFICSVLRTGSTSPDQFAYLCVTPGYTPVVGDDVECCWRDQNTAYVLWPTNRTVGQSTGPGVVPSGSMVTYGGTVAPAGWLLCDGTSYSTTLYASLFSAIGYNFGGSGSSFNVPDLRGRVVVGTGTGSGLTARTINSPGGAENALAAHTHTEGAHTHTEGSHNHSQRTVIGTYNTTGGGNVAAAFNPANSGFVDNFNAGGNQGGTGSAAGPGTGSAAGGGTGTAGSGTQGAMQPYTVCTYIIKT